MKTDTTLEPLRAFVKKHKARYWVQTCRTMTDLFARHGAIAVPSEFAGYFIGHDNLEPLPDGIRYHNLTEEYSENRAYPYTLFLLPDEKIYNDAYEEASTWFPMPTDLNFNSAQKATDAINALVGLTEKDEGVVDVFTRWLRIVDDAYEYLWFMTEEDEEWEKKLDFHMRCADYLNKPELEIRVIPATVISLDYWLSAVADEHGRCYYSLAGRWDSWFLLHFGAIKIPAAYAPLLTENTSPFYWSDKTAPDDYVFKKNFGRDEEYDEDYIRDMVIVAYRSPETFANACDMITENLRYMDSQLYRCKDEAESLISQFASYIGAELEEGIFMIPERDIEHLRSLVARAKQLIATAPEETRWIKSLRSNLEMAEGDLNGTFLPLEMNEYFIKG